MKKNYTVKYCFLLMALPWLLYACGNKRPAAQHMDAHELETDSTIIAMARPVNSYVQSDIATISPVGGSRIISVQLPGMVSYDPRNTTSIASRWPGRIERLLIKYNYQRVKKGQLIMEVYSPDLAAAQREAIYLSRTNDSEMLDRARQRLSLLGMRGAEIAQVIRTGNILYRVPVYSPVDGYILETGAAAAVAPELSNSGSAGMATMGARPQPQAATTAPAASGNAPVLLREGQYIAAGQSLFTVYEQSGLVAEFSIDPQFQPYIKRKQRILFYPVNDKQNMISGTIELLEPVLREGRNFTVGRVYIRNSGLQAGQLLTGNIAIPVGKGYWIPREAVWRSGSQSIVFVKENGAFRPKEITAGMQTKEQVQVLSDVSGWLIASNAQYLVDSESFIHVKSNTP